MHLLHSILSYYVCTEYGAGTWTCRPAVLLPVLTLCFFSFLFFLCRALADFFRLARPATSDRPIRHAIHLAICRPPPQTPQTPPSRVGFGRRAWHVTDDHRGLRSARLPVERLLVCRVLGLITHNAFVALLGGGGA